ncbi:MarR family winged helix-turn-helix transcriptional regulator [Cellulomonas sp. HZM]|uniref:MarR family winged helix-turn-helix transcriptional regulator n=1 Tax=Cellulomonas sp. HZM TaxID=1454010 RepID=UPI000558A208|nr:MarR family transcriptional regulator [Cellulomonas sp. HZM]
MSEDVDALVELTFAVQGAVAAVAAEHDVTVAQLRLLGILRDHEPTMAQLGAHLGLDKSSVSGLVDRAQRRGLVIRSAGAHDRRVVHVQVTDAGRELSARGAAAVEARLGTLLAALDPADRAALVAAARRLVAQR